MRWKKISGYVKWEGLLIFKWETGWRVWEEGRCNILRVVIIDVQISVITINQYIKRLNNNSPQTLGYQYHPSDPPFHYY